MATPDAAVEALKPIQGPPPSTPEAPPAGQAPKPEEKKGRLSRLLHRKAETPEPEDTGTAYIPREKVLDEAFTGRTFEGPKGKRKESKEKAGPIALTEKLRGEMISYLRGNLGGLIEVKEQHPNDWQDALLEADRNLLRAFTDESGNILSDSQIDAALRRPDGDVLALVTVAMERSTAMRTLSLGLIDAANERAVRQKYTRPGTIIAPAEGKRIYRPRAFMHRTLTGMGQPAEEHPALARIAATAGGALGGAALTELIRQIPADQLASLAASLATNPIAYGAAGGIILTNILLGRLPTGNADIFLKGYMESVRHWQANMTPAQRLYMKKVFGLDIDGFDTAGGQVALLPEAGTMNLDKLEREIQSNLSSLHDLYTELGRDQYKGGRRTPHQLLGPRFNNEEQIMTRWRTTIEHIAAQMPAANDLERILNHFTAEEQFLTDRLERYIGEVLGKPIDEVRAEHQRGSIQQLRDAAADRRNDTGKWAERYKARQEALQRDLKFIAGEEIDVGEGKRERRGGEQAQFNERERLQRQSDDLDQQLVSEFGKELDTTNITTAVDLEDLHTRTIYGGGPGSIRDEIGALRLVRDAEIQRLETHAAAHPDLYVAYAPTRGGARVAVGSTLGEAMQQIETKYAGLENAVVERRGKLLEQLDNLRKKRTEITQKRRAILDHENRVLRVLVERLRSDHSAIVAMGLTDQQLATETVEQLVQRIVDAGGWPDGERLLETHHEQLIHAIVEAGARETINNDVIFTPGALPSFDAVIQLGLNEDLLRILTVPEINARMNEVYLRNPAVGWPAAMNATNEPMVLEAQAVARELITIRADTYRRLAVELDTQARNQGEMADPKSIARRADQMDDVTAVMSAQGDIKTRTRKTMESTVLRPEALSVAAVGPAGGDFTTPERTLAAPQGYYEFLDLVFNYRNQPNRSSYFQRISDLLSPAELAQILYDSPRLQLIIPGMPLPPNLNAMLLQLNFNLDTDTVTAYDVTVAMEDVVDFVRAKAVSYL